MENITLATLAEIVEAIDADELAISDALAELERRIDKRAAAGKHPMVHVVAKRNELLAMLETIESEID